MNITGLTALLTELAYQTASKVEPLARAEGAKKLQDAAQSGKIRAEAATAAASANRPAGPEANPPAAPQAPLAFTPLPLRTALFPEATFFARPGEEEAGRNRGESRAFEVFICLITENIGKIWLGLFYRQDLLSVKCFTESRAVSKVLKDHFAALETELANLGFSKVSLTSSTRTELGAVVEGLLPRFEMHLLDRKI